MYGPDATFAGVPQADLEDPASYAGAGAVIIGAPFDGGTSHRPGCRFGPQAIRLTDYLPHDGRRPHLALDVEPLLELGVVDVGDVLMVSGETEEALSRLEAAVTTVARSGAIPIILGGDHTVALPDVTGVAHHVGWGRVSVIHFDADAPPD
jgi:arginase family enzyme